MLLYPFWASRIQNCIFFAIFYLFFAITQETVKASLTPDTVPPRGITWTAKPEGIAEIIPVDDGTAVVKPLKAATRPLPSAAGLCLHGLRNGRCFWIGDLPGHVSCSGFANGGSLWYDGGRT